jgi:tetratricopeptide (TPR) repeat protein
MTGFKTLVLVSFMALLAACGGAVKGEGALSPEKKSGKADAKGHEVSKVAAASFDTALDQFAGHDKKQDWDDAACTSIAKSFNDAADAQKSDTGRPFPEAQYNAGLAYQRCGKDTDARAEFEAVVKSDPSFHRARAQIALYDYAKSGDLDGAISKLDQIIHDAKFQNVEALVSLAALQMERGNDQSDQDGKDDLERAQRNLQRALAIDDGYMPAFNQLAVYYLTQAKAKAGMVDKTGKRRGMEVSGASKASVDAQQLDLAALVAAQAQKKNPNYAPISNTTGLIQVQLKNFNGAVKSFGRARQLDPTFFEAQMNYAAVNLSFRGYEEAEKAYRDALKLHPKDYEAELGLALALRGEINDANFDQNVAEAQQHLDEAKKIAPDRPETYYNEAILTQEFRAKRGAPVPTLKKAAEQYQTFIEKAGSDPAFAAAVKRSKDRSQDIADTVKFIEEGEQAAKDAAANPPPPPPPADGAAPPADGATPQPAGSDKTGTDKAGPAGAGADKGGAAASAPATPASADTKPAATDATATPAGAKPANSKK